MRIVRRRYVAVTALAVACAFGIGACGDSGSTAAIIEETTTTEESTTTTARPEPCSQKSLFEAAARYYSGALVPLADVTCSSAWGIATIQGDVVADLGGEAIGFFTLEGQTFELVQVVAITADPSTSAPAGVPAVLVRSWQQAREARLAEAAEATDEVEETPPPEDTVPPDTEPVAPEEPVETTPAPVEPTGPSGPPTTAPPSGGGL